MEYLFIIKTVIYTSSSHFQLKYNVQLDKSDVIIS